MIIVTPKEINVLPSKSNEETCQLGKHLSIYLGGSIDYDPESDWQSKVISKITNSSIDYGQDTVIYNPRKTCCSNNPGCYEVLFDESWQSKCLKNSDIIIVNFVPGHEDGLYLLSDSELRDKMIVVCPYKHKHFNTAKYICKEHGVHFVTGKILDENDILESIIKFLHI